MDKDSRGVKRGKCTNCANCAGYRRDEGAGGSNVCKVCRCAPGKHQNAAMPVSGSTTGDGLVGPAQLTSRLIRLRLNGSNDDPTDSVVTNCKYCRDEVHFDINTGIEHEYCKFHLANPLMPTGGTTVVNSGYADQDGDSPTGAIATVACPQPLPATPAQISLAKSIQASQAVCAIEECCNPRYVDSNGTVHKCCGYSHAMELNRRKIIEGINNVWTTSP